jgi:hypothetical protein
LLDNQCRDLGLMNSGKERTVRDDAIYAQYIVSGCTNQIEAGLSNVNNNPLIDPLKKSTGMNS